MRQVTTDEKVGCFRVAIIRNDETGDCFVVQAPTGHQIALTRLFTADELEALANRLHIEAAVSRERERGETREALAS